MCGLTSFRKSRVYKLKGVKEGNVDESDCESLSFQVRGMSVPLMSPTELESLVYIPVLTGVDLTIGEMHR